MKLDFTRRAKRPNDVLGSVTKPGGGGLSRFLGTSHHGNHQAATLRADHPAITQATTVFPKSVADAATSPRLLVHGKNNPKIGGMILKGPWAGCRVFHLTLVERETCPTSCVTWHECYGNAMPFARRHRPGNNTAAMTRRLETELIELLSAHGRIAVRLHVLGDFFSLSYLAFWARMIRDHEGLHVWGYTARQRDASQLGEWLDMLNRQYPDRWAMRFSGAPHDDMATGIIWRQPEDVVVPEGRVCPASAEKTAACGTCGLCWAKNMRATRIVFVGHGKRSNGQEIVK